VFWNIRKLKVGDTAQYKTADGEVINYVVVSSDALSVNSDWDKIVASSTADMTLITCTGTFSGGEYNQRHVVALKKV
jgi:LPXTG-site transpeptidase (sortase) family protein